jgi:hypothetical protein
MALRALILASVLVLAGAAPALAKEEPPNDKPEGSSNGMAKKAGEIVTQPVRDVGLDKKDIPTVLVDAAKDPYSLKGLKTCRQLSASLLELNAALGPDFGPGGKAKENRGAKLAEAGGKTVVNSLIPFRQLVREISGAAPAQRSLNAAVDAGLARRGFLRGVHLQRGCKTPY